MQRTTMCLARGVPRKDKSGINFKNNKGKVETMPDQETINIIVLALERHKRTLTPFTGEGRDEIQHTRKALTWMKALQRGDAIVEQWSVDDAYSLSDDLTNDEARAVLQHVKDNHDAEQGINYEVLNDALDYELSRRRKK